LAANYAVDQEQNRRRACLLTGLSAATAVSSHEDPIPKTIIAF